MGNVRRIVYVGSDTNHLDKVKQRYNKQYGGFHTYKFDNIWNWPIGDYYGLYFRLIENRPDIIYVDFTEKTEYLFDVFRMIASDIFFTKIPTIGLIEGPELLAKCRGLNLDFIHIKCAEHHDTAYDPMYVAFPKFVTKPAFALAQFKKDDSLIVDFYIVSITVKSIQVEGNIKFEIGEIVSLENNFQRSVISSIRFKVSKMYTQDMRYDCSYGYEMDFCFVDEPRFDKNGIEVDENERPLKPITEETNSQDIVRLRNERIEEYKNDFQIAVKAHQKWVIDHLNDYKFPETKILLIDNEMTILKNVGQSLAKSNFSVYTQTYLSESLSIIDRRRPDIIVFHYFRKLKLDAASDEPEKDEKIEEELAKSVQTKMIEEEEVIEEHRRDTLEQLQDLMKYIKADQKYTPFIVIWGCRDLTTASFQTTFGYKKVMVLTEKINIDFVLKMASMHEGAKKKKYTEMVNAKIAQLKKQDPAKYRNLRPTDFDEQRCHIKKNSRFSFAEYRQKVMYLSMTESEVGFSVNKTLDKCIYRSIFPTECAFTLVDPIEKARVNLKKGEFYYHGLLHSIGEHEKKKIRLFVNKIFFSDIDEKKKKELEEFKKLNEKEIKKEIEEEVLSDGEVPTGELGDDDPKSD